MRRDSEETGVASSWSCRVIRLWCLHFIAAARPYGPQSGVRGWRGQGALQEGDLL